jgi:serralysin
MTFDPVSFGEHGTGGRISATKLRTRLQATTSSEDSAGAYQLTAKSFSTAFTDNINNRLLAAPAPTPAELLATALVPDDIPNNSTTTRTVTVGGPRIISTINTPGDQDWFKVVLQAGVTYEIGEYGTRYGPTGVPLRDPLVELYDSNGNMLRMDDSGGPDNQVSDDALILFTPEVSGTYYINARAWDTSDPVGAGIDLNPATTTGDYVGDYEVFARVSTLPADYYPIRYETVNDPNTARNEIGMPTLDSSPLHAIDWQTQFDGTSRNPDGAEGPRVTGNPVESKIGGKNVIYYYFAREGEVFVDNAANPQNLTTTMVAKGMAAWEKQAFDLALDQYEKVADVVYVETEDRYAADIVVITYNGTPGPFTPSVLGRMSPPDTASEGQVEFNALDQRWSPEGLAPGGFYFGTLVHELGHGHGMAHTHDTGGGRASILRGVEEIEPLEYSYGDFNLNEGIYSMMSYNFGWETSPYGQPASDAGYGYIGSLMAMDIAVIQDKYGVNEEWATGNDTYTLSDENVTAQFDANGNTTRQATSFTSIWDAGGIDEIVYNGARDTVIDLRPASLKYETGGGGWLSYAWGIHGGFTIANSVTIENATSGSGNDKLTGNAANNRLSSGAGNDTIVAAAGDDILDGGAGVDRLEGGAGNDRYYVDSGDTVIELAGEGSDIVYARSTYTLTAGAQVELLAAADGNSTTALDLTGNELNNTIQGNAGANRLLGGGGDDYLTGFGGNDTLDGGAGRDTMVGGLGDDRYYVDSGDKITELAGQGSDIAYARTSYVLNAGAQVESLFAADGAATTALDLTGNEANNTLQGNAGSNLLLGGAGLDYLSGLGGNDVLDGGAGADILLGGAGADSFRFTAAGDSPKGGADRINDFLSGTDKIDLSLIDANSGVAGNQAFTFLGTGAFTGVAGQLRYDVVGSQAHIFADTNGDGLADLQIIVSNTPLVAAGDFVL